MSDQQRQSGRKDTRKKHYIPQRGRGGEEGKEMEMEMEDRFLLVPEKNHVMIVLPFIYV